MSSSRWQDRKSKIYSAFPGCGKSYMAKRVLPKVTDSDSSEWPKDETWPQSYINHIQELNADPSVDLVMVSSHADVRRGLVDAGLMFNLVYPQHCLKDEYLERYRIRESPQAFIDLLDQNWDNWLQELQNQYDCNHIVLTSKQYISDIM